MAKLLTIPTFLPNKSIVLNKPEEFIKAQYSASGSRNMEFYNELLQGRLGLTKFDETVLSGPVLLQDQYWKFTSTWYLMICTTKDIYKYDFSNLRYDILTPTYTTGTIEVKTGELNKVYGSSTVWGTNLKAGDYIKIGSGDIHTGSTWYEIDSVDSDTLLTLTSNAVITTAGTAYVARKIFSGSNSNQWSSVTYVDKNLGDVWIATNGVDTPVRYTGTGQVQALANLPTGFTSAKFVNEYKDRLVFAWTVEGGNQPQRIRWSNVADCEDWEDLDFMDFIEDGYWITGSIKFADYLILMRERDAIIFRYVGSNYTFDYEKSSTCAGCWAPLSIQATESYIFYYGPDNKFHAWNILRDDIISEEIFPYTKEFDPNTESLIFGWQVEAKNQIRWFVPYTKTSYHNAVIVFDYAQNILQIWEYSQAQALCSMGEYLNLEDLYVDDAPWADYYLDEQEGYWDDRNFLEGAPIVIYGGYDGIIRRCDVGYNDDGETYNRIFESMRMNFRIPDRNKRLWKQQYWLNSDISGSVTVSVKKDDNNNYEALTKEISLIDTARDIIKENITWDKEAQNFKFKLSATNHFALLGFMNYVFSKGSLYR